MSPPLAIALLSGGLDSATAAALAIEAGYRVIGLSLDYGQRHRRELQAAAELAQLLGLAEHHTIAVNLAAWGGSALTDSAIAVPSAEVEAGVIPSPYVPEHNTVFIASALRLAEALSAPTGAGRERCRLLRIPQAVPTTSKPSRPWVSVLATPRRAYRDLAIPSTGRK